MPQTHKTHFTELNTRTKPRTFH